ncbi:DUF1850 domain-containing protein [Haloterrigena sp. SYSU A558-1]|uniref:DUF1850 domain-containing protein n=1 Tax=Haloterrigena gelatinilytica TaxID=2741724 RepID=A0A8J8GIE1_9EURY|nr:DUF1850 domain-containing protein [Haloterrigena gelatinilytica]NUB90231.1 DUF1850 domain-containing protein [Haloterrigena gelatinilytica]NUC73946.1 DUF1850 domain-containing protein [Haloterrigena gelatinilytica]
MERSTKWYGSAVVVAALVVFVATGAVVASGATERTLVVADADSGEPLLEVPVDEGDEVILSYTHSVEKTPVQDVYVVDGTELRADRVVFHSHGAGLPSDEPIERTDEGFVVDGEGSHEEIVVSPGSIAGHELVVDGDRYDLVERSNGSVVLAIDGTIGDRLTALRGIDSAVDDRSESDARSGRLLV